MILIRHAAALRRACAAAGLALALASGGALAQDIGEGARARSATASDQIQKLEQAGDFAAARDAAERTAKHFERDGEKFLAAIYLLTAMQGDARLENWKRIDETYGPRFDALLADLDRRDPGQGDRLVHVMGYAKAGVGDRAAQDRLGALYIERIRKREGADSQPGLMAPLDVAVIQIRTGEVEAGYQRAVPALEAVAASTFHNLTMARYHEVAMALLQARRADLAEQIFQSGGQTEAAQQVSGETGEFYAAWARLRRDTGDFLNAYQLFDGAVRNIDQTGDWPRALTLRNEYANSLNNTGATGKAIIFMEDTIHIAEQMLGEDHDTTLDLYVSYAEISRNFGAPAIAAQADKDVYDKRLARYGESDERVLAAANGLGQDYLALEDFAEARRHFELSRKLAEQQKEHGENIAMNADAWLFLTDVLEGRVARDEATEKRLVAIADDDGFARVLRVLAAKEASDLIKARGDVTAAFQLLQRTYQLSSETFTGDHPLSYGVALQIANTIKEEDPQGAANTYDDLSEAMNRWIDLQSRLSNNTVVAELLRGHADALLADFARFAETEELAKAPFIRAAYRWKTLVGGGMTAFRRLEQAAAAKDAQTTGLIRNTLRLNAQMGAVMSSTPNDEKTALMLRQYEQTAGTLMSRLQELGITPQTNEATFDLSADLDEGEVFVNYFLTRRWGPDRLAEDAVREQTLYAVVTGSDGKSEIVRLGDPRELDRIGRETQIASLRGTRGVVPLVGVRKPFVELYDRLFKPLEAALKDARTVYIAPDGELFSVPFSMVQDARGRFIEDRFALRVLTSPDAVIGANARPKPDPKGEVLLVGDVDYRRGKERGAEPLPATAKEIEAIAGMQRARGAPVRMLTGAKATEAELRKAIGGASIVHLATHGSFGSQKEQGAAGVDTLWQSEILLAGAGDTKAQQRDDNDGRLYAFEVMDWDLSGLDLLVLSACETGRGDQSFITGLRGLPTALGVAGARRSLLTLWPVADEGTASFMIRYYEYLDDGMTYADALRQTRRDAREGKVAAAQDPRVWAAFVLFEG